MGLLPPLRASGAIWSVPAIADWWDVSRMLMLEGIPWNCYFQRVLSCQTPAKALWHSILAGLLTIAFSVPPRYLYTTDGGRWSLATNLLGSIWAIALLAILWQWHGAPRALLVAPLIFPAHYLGVSWLTSLRRLSGARSVLAVTLAAVAALAASSCGRQVAPDPSTAGPAFAVRNVTCAGPAAAPTGLRAPRHAARAAGAFR